MKLQSIENYYQRIQFPGGIKEYPMHHLDALVALRQPGGKAKGNILFQGEKIAFESRAEKKEIYRVLKILGAISIKTQALALVTPSGKKFYPDVIAQLQDGSILVMEVKHVLDFLWCDVIEKYQTMLAYCKLHGYGALMMDGHWRDFHFLKHGGTIHFPQVIEWFESVIDKKGIFTMKDLRFKFPQPKYWPTLVSYCLLNNYQSNVSFRHPDWGIQVNN
jgi:hypothetical protein